jgi:pilus assembly protein CpaE
VRDRSEKTGALRRQNLIAEGWEKQPSSSLALVPRHAYTRNAGFANRASQDPILQWLERLAFRRSLVTLLQASGSSKYAMSDFSRNHDVPGAGGLSIALIGPDDKRRRELAGALAGFQGASVKEFSSFPAELDDLPRMLAQHYDAVLVDLDSDPDYAFDIVESICAHGSTSVMVYSSESDLQLAIRFMRAGAREFLTLPLGPTDLAGALARISVRGPAGRPTRKTTRRLFVFLGAKGGCGVTTIASNFAIALAQESGRSTLLIDLGLPLGDAAINLGMVTEYSTQNALQDASRLDANFLSSLLARHSSGLFVLAAPGEFSQIEPSHDAIDKLLAVARHQIDYNVVDAGSRLDLMGTSLFEDSSIVYLVTQVGVSELRNSNRLISQFFAARGRNLQIVLNRYTPHALLFDERHISKALTRSAQWRLPDDFSAARRTQNTATPLVLEDSPISSAIRLMARAACGLPAHPEKKSGFGLFVKEIWPFPRAMRAATEPEPE